MIGLMPAFVFALGSEPVIPDAPSRPVAVENIAVDEYLDAPVPPTLLFRRPSGERVRLGDLVGAGKPALLVLAYSECPMLCSLVLRGVVEAARGMSIEPGDAYELVVVSIDPSESQSVAAQAQGRLAAAAGYPAEPTRVEYLLGGQPAIDTLADALGFQYAYDERSQQYAHPAVVFVITPTGRIAQYMYGLRHDPTVLESHLLGQAEGEPTTVQSLLECFRFDPATRKYAGLVRGSLQLTGGVVLFCLGAALLLWARRRRP